MTTKRQRSLHTIIYLVYFVFHFLVLFRLFWCGNEWVLCEKMVRNNYENFIRSLCIRVCPRVVYIRQSFSSAVCLSVGPSSIPSTLFAIFNQQIVLTPTHPYAAHTHLCADVCGCRWVAMVCPCFKARKTLVAKRVEEQKTKCRKKCRKYNSCCRRAVPNRMYVLQH